MIDTLLIASLVSVCIMPWLILTAILISNNLKGLRGGIDPVARSERN